MEPLARIEKTIEHIMLPDQNAIRLAELRQNSLTKPPGSLGRLEKLSLQIAGITRQARPKLKDKAVIVMAGDHGVTAEGVSAYPPEVTPQMVANMLAGGAAINVLARQAGARVLLVDMGVAAPLPQAADLIDRKIAPGTGNIARGPAMSQQQAMQAVAAGIEVFEEQLGNGLDLVATGEMGIGNTTPSAAIGSVLTGQPASALVGRGTGVDDAGLLRKTAVVEMAIAANQPDRRDAMDVLTKVGGFEIGGLAGVILAAAASQRPVVVDGFISTAAAMLAVALAPDVRAYLIAGHCSEEGGHALMLDWLGLQPLLDLGFRLGEGTGAVLAFTLVDAACRLLDEMATFAEAGVSGKQ